MGKGEGPGSPQGEGFAVAPARGGGSQEVWSERIGIASARVFTFA